MTPWLVTMRQAARVARASRIDLPPFHRQPLARFFNVTTEKETDMLNKILKSLSIGAFQSFTVMGIWAIVGTALVVYVAKGF
jgi:hypothetical protein